MPARPVRRRSTTWLAGAVALACLAGCAGPLGELRGRVPAAGAAPGVPLVEQRRDHCGPASLAALLTWSGAPTTPEELAPLVFLPGRRGTLPLDLPREIRARGRLAYPVPGRFAALLGELAAGHPALVLENRGLTWIPVWHYSVLVGYDLASDLAVLHAGGPAPEALRLATLRRTWERGGGFALLALPAGQLPAAEDPGGILAALTDLEEAGQPAPAAVGYAAFLERWPDDWRGAFGWGNALHASGDPGAAADAFRRAHATAPERPEPLNNLALLALREGQPEQAVSLAQMAGERARALGLPAATYDDTLQAARTGLAGGAAPP